MQTYSIRLTMQTRFRVINAKSSRSKFHSLIGSYDMNRIHIAELWNFAFRTIIYDTQRLSFSFVLIQYNITTRNSEPEFFENGIWIKLHFWKFDWTYFSVISKLHGIKKGMWWRSCLRHCPQIPKVVGSILNGDTGIFHCINPSGHTMALESTQPLTAMSTRDIPLGTMAAGA
jgi:hypothetical protein